jgi:hypothetical protein
MIIALILSVVSTTILVFFAGYRLALHHKAQQHMAWLDYLNGQTESLEPIFAKLDREYAYTDELSKPFTDDK